MRLKSVLPRVLAVCLLWDISTCIAAAKNAPPAIFIFGDSMVDVGNNYYIDTIAKPTLPNGVDFGTGKASGRYCNGRVIVDIIGQQLGFENFTPPYLAPTTTGDIVLKGVNYASSGSGILNDTGHSMGDHISLDSQIEYFEKTKQDIMSRIGTTAARNLLRHSLYFITTGSNDVSRAIGSSLRNSSRDAFVEKLISHFRYQLIKLYYLGARKIVVSNCACIGYMPFVRDTVPNDEGYAIPSNQLARYFNSRLKRLLTELTASHAGSIYVYSDDYALLENLIQNRETYGFENVDSACCHKSGSHGGLIPCISSCQVCKNRNKYVFWDAFHPTEAANLISAELIMDGGLNFISPVNIRQLLNFSVN